MAHIYGEKFKQVEKILFLKTFSFGNTFQRWDTGGGQEGMGHQFKDGRQILVTSQDGEGLPSPGNWVAGFYNKDGEQEFWLNSDGDWGKI